MRHGQPLQVLRVGLDDCLEQIRKIGDARIAGVESTVEWVPVDGPHLSFSGNYNDAGLRGNEYQNPSFMVLPGERLSEAPLFNCRAVAL